MNQSLSIKTRICIQKPPMEVFKAIVDPEKMSNYFISKGSGMMESGKELQWSFPEFDGAFPVRVKEVVTGELVAFAWDHKDKEHLVEIKLEKYSNGTSVTVTEKEEPVNEEGIAWLKGNTEGWANFLSCMKAYLDHGINLRKGAFDFLKAE